MSEVGDVLFRRSKLYLHDTTISQLCSSVSVNLWTDFRIDA